MNTLCVVPCGKRKIWDAHPTAGPTCAKNVYIGPFAAKCREYAVRFYQSSWCILSAKHGFLLPEDEVPGPYNTSFKDKKTNPISLEDLRRRSETMGLNNYSTIVVLGGKTYVDIVKKVLNGPTIINPLKVYRGNGYMQQAMTRAIRNGISL